ncbi:biliverdin reductase A [Ctenodactylus gundi]
MGNVLLSGGFYKSEGEDSLVTAAAHKGDDDTASLSPPPSAPRRMPPNLSGCLRGGAQEGRKPQAAARTGRQGDRRGPAPSRLAAANRSRSTASVSSLYPAEARAPVTPRRTGVWGSEEQKRVLGRVAPELLFLSSQPLKEENKMTAEPERKFGVVVVGVGRAGSVRIRDLRNPQSSSAFLNLIGFVSRRELGNLDGVQQISLEDALSSQEVEVAYICSESTTHEDYIRRFLSAGKHVLVEYPMTLSAAGAQELWALAEQKGKVLHEEHVELLMEEFAFLKKEVLGKELQKGSLRFTAGPLEEERFGFPSFSGISRLTWLVSLFGELSLVSATLEERKEEKYMKMTVSLETENKCPLSWIEEKGPGFKRNRYLSFHFKSGSLENVPDFGVNKNIFLKDQNIFVQKLLGRVSEKELAAEKKRILHCLALAEEIQKACCPM